MSYAISRWPATDQILKQLDVLVRQPLRPLQRDHMAAYLAQLDAQCPGSKRLAAEASQIIPAIQHTTAFDYPFPIFFDKAAGPYLWDVDGNRYIDFAGSGGPVMLGHGVPAVRDKVIALLREGSPSIGLYHESELQLARLIQKHMPSIEMFRMLGSGTEAVMGAIRLARAYTGKRKIIKVGGDFHGWSDQMFYSLHIPRTKQIEANGIPDECFAHTQEVFPNDLDELRALMQANAANGGTAAVILEPLGPESATRPVLKDYNRQVRELCDEFGALLIFDEVVTGFRVGLGGAQGYFGVTPDLTVLGKCIAGGFPGAGGIGGRREVMARLKGGFDTKVYVGGTLAAACISCVAGCEAIREMERSDALGKAGRAGDRLVAGLNAIIQRLDLPYVAYNFGSICHLQTSGLMVLDITDPQQLMELGARKIMLEEMGAAYTAEGIITIAGSRIYTNAADTDAVIDDALQRFERVLCKVEA